MSDLQTMMTSYWKDPDAGTVVRVFLDLPVDDAFRAETLLTIPVFLAHVMDASPALAEILVDGCVGGDPVKVEMLAQALNYCHLDDRARLMERLVGEAAAARMDLAGADFSRLQPTHPVHVDMLWMSFFATGQGLYLDRIVDLLSGWLPETSLQTLLSRAATDPVVQAQALNGLLAKAAQVTLAAHGADCVPVCEALSRRAQLKDGLAAAMAARILAGIQC